MTSTVTLIHATTAAMPTMLDALRSVPGIRVLNQLDEGLMSEIERNGELGAACEARMGSQIELAVSAGSDVVVTTCNAYSLVMVKRLRARFSTVPIVVIDEPMVRLAVKSPSVSVIATVRAGLDSQRQLLEAIASQEGANPSVTYALREDALLALRDGRPDEHDRILLAELDRLASTPGVIMLAQASMARVMGIVPTSYADRVLSSPVLAAKEVASIVGARGCSEPTGASTW